VQLFVMGEVAVELFQETPTAFLQVRVHLNSFAREYPTHVGVLA
jgi:hypothetical protein